MQCVILAGGLGTRMAPLSDGTAKSLLVVAGHPFVHHQLAWLARAGASRVVMCVGHHGAAVRAFVGDGSAWRLDVRCIDDGPTLLGTAGALRHAGDALDDAFFVVYGDSYLPLSLAPVEAAFRRARCPALMTVLRNRGRWGVSNVELSGDRVRRYDKALPAPAMDCIDYGLSVLTREVLDAHVPPDASVDLATVFHALSLEGDLAALEVYERFYEVGSPAGLADLDAHLREQAAS